MTKRQPDQNYRLESCPQCSRCWVVSDFGGPNTISARAFQRHITDWCKYRPGAPDCEACGDTGLIDISSYFKADRCYKCKAYENRQKERASERS